MKRVISFIVISYLFILASHAQAKTRLEFDLSYKKTLFDELRDQQKFLDKKIRQESLTPKFLAAWLIFPNWLYVEADISYDAYSLSHSGHRSFSFLRQGARLGISLPARPLNVTLIAEQFYQQMRAKPDDFGYDSTNGMQYYPLVDFSLPGGSRLFIKYPLFKNVSGRQELTAGFHWRLAGSPMAYPANLFQKSMVLKFEYSDEKLKFQNIRNVELRIRTISAGIGLNF